MSATVTDPRTPVIVGVGQVVQHPGTGEPLDPIGLAVAAARRAGADSGVGDRLLRRVQSGRHVATTGWRYTDEAALVAAALGATPRETVRTSQFGGDGPQRLVGDTAAAIAGGTVEIALITGAEALATSISLQRTGAQPTWPEQADGTPTRVLAIDRAPVNDAESAVGLMAPVNVYAMLETAVRAGRGVSRAEHLADISELWSRYSAVAATNPYAWLRREYSAAEIAGAAGGGNRPVSEPYTKLLTANLGVDQAAAVLMCSVQVARDLGIASDRWVFPLASAAATEEWFVSERHTLAASPAIRAASGAVLSHVGISIDDVAVIDLYSCFPSAVQIAAAELGLNPFDPGRALTVTGGLTFGGGPGNNYALHAIATVVDRLREAPEAIGLSSSLGWYATKHAYGLYSATPPARPFRSIDAEPLIDAPPARVATASYSGPATLESYTVPYERDGTPEAAVLSALAPDGTRVLHRTDDPDVIARLLEQDPLGEPIELPEPILN